MSFGVDWSFSCSIGYLVGVVWGNSSLFYKIWFVGNDCNTVRRKYIVSIADGLIGFPAVVLVVDPVFALCGVTFFQGLCCFERLETGCLVSTCKGVYRTDSKGGGAK